MNKKTNYIEVAYSRINDIVKENKWKISLLNSEKSNVHHAFSLKKGKYTLLFFASSTPKVNLKKIAAKINKQEDKKEIVIPVLIVKNSKELTVWQNTKNISNWQGGYFYCLDNHKVESKINSFNAKIVANIHIGGKGSPFYKLRFYSQDLQDVGPAQFIMLDTKSNVKIKKQGQIVELNSLITRDNIDNSTKSFLKRPFGLHRAYFSQLNTEKILRFNLPKELFAQIHSSKPELFDLVYKVLENGLGTNELKHIKKGANIKMVGPIGSAIDFDSTDFNGIDEVHFIGGGVGMAPLAFMSHFFISKGIDVKSFIGVESLESILHKDSLMPKKEALLYYHDAIGCGINKKDVYIACENGSKKLYGVKKSNYHIGFNAQQYKNYLKENRKRNGVLVFACGPLPMMNAVQKITDKNKLPLKLLLESRMACGFGVCLSCVCKTKKGYVRVCTDGPVFDASELIL